MPGGDDLIKAVFDFGGAWLKSAGKLTLHDPLAAVSAFYPRLCGFERGTVRVETARACNMGGTRFFLDPAGNVEIARTADRAQFYRVLVDTLLRRAGPQ